MLFELLSRGRQLRGVVNGSNGNELGGNEHSGRAGEQTEEVARLAENDASLVLQEIMRLVDASREGRFSERGQAIKFNGVHREMLQGVNEMLDAILLPIAEENRVLAQISAGKIDEVITQTYKGDHEKMKLAINNVAQVMQILLAMVTRLANAAKEGKLTDRGHPEQVKGAYSEIIIGMNSMIDAIVTPLNVAADYVDKISKGIDPGKITAAYNGDFNTIKNNLNACIDAVQALCADATMLSKAAVEGKLSARADASKHHGDYRKVIEGVNSTLDAVTGPLNTAAEHIARISKGDIPDLITASYNGEFNAIKHNLNALITAMNEITAAAEEIANGNLTVRIQDRSEKDTLMQALTAMVVGLTRTVSEIRSIAGEVAAASQSISTASVQVSKGASYSGRGG